MEVHITIDFYDDLILANRKWDEAILRETVREIARRNITTIHWIDHGRLNTGLWDEGHYLNRDGIAQELAKTVPDPLGVVCDEAHKVGLKVIAVIKPWDFAFGMPYDSVPPSDPAAKTRLPHLGGFNSATRFTRENPHVRLRLHPSLLPSKEELALPISTLRIWHESAQLPAKPKVSLWVSADNTDYQLYDGPMKVEYVTRRRKPPVFAPAPEKKFGEEADFGCIEIAGLNIKEPFVCVQFEGQTQLANKLEALVELRGPKDELLTYTYGLNPRLKRGVQDVAAWKTVGIGFDSTRGGTPVTRTHAGAAESGGRFRAEVDKLPLLAIARGRNEYLPGPIEFAYPEVQKWLLSIIEEALDSGADGIDMRQSTHTESLNWEDYGFNEPIIEAFRKRYGVDPVTQPFDRAAWRSLRGEFYYTFLVQASKLTRERGGQFIMHLEKFMGLPNTGPTWQGMAWQWEKSLSSGILDGVTFKSGVHEGPAYGQAMALCRKHNLQTIFTRKPSSRVVEDFTKYFAQARAEDFDAINLYELAVFATLGEDGKLDFKYDGLWELVSNCKPGAAAV